MLSRRNFFAYLPFVNCAPLFPMRTDLHSIIAIAHQLPHTGEIHCPHPIMIFSFNQINAFKLDRNRKQFSLRPLYATTFNGFQGLTLEKAVLDLRTYSFTHGQLYTAHSRV
ncbi:uncharacterized protein F5891DRAFT_1027759 [Suillus fuscotomentosus]|uniref:Uncharacterized protein n=1 Tax=Suillus fuscotomentosus TaxID=1912939 RepID=A0AAD4E9B8_9AGAM|nr:uncharacterized protein F5891DRAFT_1027759 [Suillus fuscotomentosus]KAG1901757.1 hypothetical protein F5891DRAFT_1027759 [Suillus fuscotomentosus]